MLLMGAVALVICWTLFKAAQTGVIVGRSEAVSLHERPFVFALTALCQMALLSFCLAEFLFAAGVGEDPKLMIERLLGLPITVTT